MSDYKYKPRIYLDIDGVIISKNSEFQRRELNRYECYSPEVAVRIKKTAMDIFWLSSWGHEANYLSRNIGEYAAAKALSVCVDSLIQLA